ncbi:hypothetical protein [Enterovibrio norvegicus]|uniref:hypothetical protein n=1 Tax=Enterovibrio norvegicus TaxID=188144 RepID=UPI00352CAC90
MKFQVKVSRTPPELAIFLFMITGFLVSFGVTQLSSGLGYILHAATVIFTIFGVMYLCITSLSSAATPWRLMLTIGILAGSANVSSLIQPSFFHSTLVTKIEQPKTQILAGTFGDTFYMNIPELAKVDGQVANFSPVFVVRAQTSEGWFHKTYVCETETLNSDCIEAIIL